MKIVEVESFTVTGEEARTSNAKEMAGEGKIGVLWSRANELAGAPVAVYSDYEDGKNGEYSFLLGVKVTDGGTGGPAERRILAGNYMIFEAPAPISPPVIMGLWQQIWSIEDGGGLRRAYQTDFEDYSSGGVEIYIGLQR